MQTPELKASRLMGSERGRRLTVALRKAIECGYIVSINDKLLLSEPDVAHRFF
jgi:hypothetical protein